MSVLKLVVIGGTGLIGSKVVAKLTEHGHEAIAAARSDSATAQRIRGDQ